MPEKPILFSGEMVRAILNGSKTQTRRCHIKPHPPEGTQAFRDVPGTSRWWPAWVVENEYGTEYHPMGSDFGEWRVPYQVGDLLWVRETWRPHEEFEGADMPYLYQADYPEGLNVHWKHSLFMPKKAARLWLKVTGVRVERLQEISLNDCVAEGIDLDGKDAEMFAAAEHAHNAGLSYGCKYPEIYPFSCLWDSLNGEKEGFTWKDNPWIAVYEFERIST